MKDYYSLFITITIAAFILLSGWLEFGRTSSNIGTRPKPSFSDKPKQIGNLKVDTTSKLKSSNSSSDTPKYTTMELKLLKVNVENFNSSLSNISKMTVPTRQRIQAYQNEVLHKNRDCNFKQFQDILLAINYNFPHYDNTNLLREFYEPVFGKVIFCGETERKDLGIIKINENKGYQGYGCLAAAMKLFPNYKGYLYGNDDLIINWWNLKRMDINKLWFSEVITTKDHFVIGQKGIPKSNWSWWGISNVRHSCEAAFGKVENLQHTDIGKRLSIKRHIDHFMKNSNNIKMCLVGFSDIFYIPTRYKDIFIQISDIFVNEKAYLEVAVPMILAFLDDFSNISSLRKTVLWGNPPYERIKKFYEQYSYELDYIHPLKLNSVLNQIFFKNIIQSLSKNIIHNCFEEKKT